MFGGYCVPSTRQRAKLFEPVEVFRQTETPSLRFSKGVGITIFFQTDQQITKTHQ